MIDELKKSDDSIRAMKLANKGGSPPAESAEQRESAKKNSGSQTTRRTQSRESVLTAAHRIRQAAKRHRKERLTALLHHITPEALKASFLSIRKDAAVGVDKVTWQEYEEGLDARLRDLHRRVHTGAYRAEPVRRVNIPKPDGSTRPLGIASLEDKIVQRAVVDVILNPIYGPPPVCKRNFSYGRVDCSHLSDLFVRDFCPLAPMEFAPVRPNHLIDFNYLSPWGYQVFTPAGLPFLPSRLITLKQPGG